VEDGDFGKMLEIKTLLGQMQDWPFRFDP